MRLMIVIAICVTVVLVAALVAAVRIAAKGIDNDESDEDDE